MFQICHKINSWRPPRLFWRLAALPCLMLMAGCATNTPAELAHAEALPPATLETEDPTTISGLQAAVSENPQNAQLHYRLGNMLFDAGRMVEARTAYEQVVALNPTDAAAWCNLGLTLRRLGDNPGAVTAYERALSLEPGDTTTLKNLVAAMRIAGNVDGAIDGLHRLVELMPSDEAVLTELAQLLYEERRFDETAKALERLIAVTGGTSGDYYNLGLCHFNQEQWAAAVQPWLKAIEMDPNHVSALRGLPVLYWKMGDYGKAWDYVKICQSKGIPLETEFLAALRQNSGRTGPE
ncbi:MAG: tetratricopeptide repeat protein [Candidatus Hydrogenedentes bacterium]|nr:tetratricopeptide repeat protein [Candidatus Hydrogenedentota bacterium]